jgi:PTS system sucrose-specific IIC component
MGLIGGGIGGFMASIFHLKATGMAITVIPGTLLYLNSQLPLYILCNLTAMAITFVLTWMFGFNDKMLDDLKTEAK